MNEILFLRFFTALATTNADDPDIHAANDYAISLVKSNRAALARAEAAEAEAGQLRDELAAMTERVTFARRSASLAENALETARSRWDEAERREKSIFDSAMGIADQRDTLATRVAELEAASDAQGWRPVTEKPAAPGRYLVWCPSPWPGYEIAPYDRGWGYIDLRFTHWQPLPPAPDTQEPTL